MFDKYVIKQNGLGQYGVFKRFFLFFYSMLTPWSPLRSCFMIPPGYINHCEEMRKEVGVNSEGFFEKYEDALIYLHYKELGDIEKNLQFKFKEVKNEN